MGFADCFGPRTTQFVPSQEILSRTDAHAVAHHTDLCPLRDGGVVPEWLVRDLCNLHPARCMDALAVRAGARSTTPRTS